MRVQREVIWASALIFFSVLPGCSTTKQAREIQPSGFLGDYSALRKGIANEPLLLYANPTANCRLYDRVMLDPVTLWAKSQDSSIQQLPDQERAMLKSLGDQALRDIFVQANFKVVHSAGAGVLRVRAAITEAEKANVLLQDVSMVAPYASGAAVAYAQVKGQGLFTGDLAWEYEMTDSLSGERLAASVDKRVGLMDLRNTGDWDFLKEAIAKWKDRAVQRLQACRQTGSFMARSREQSLDDSVSSFRP